MNDRDCKGNRVDGLNYAPSHMTYLQRGLLLRCRVAVLAHLKHTYELDKPIFMRTYSTPLLRNTGPNATSPRF
jgi:hypothetical protein